MDIYIYREREPFVSPEGLGHEIDEVQHIAMIALGPDSFEEV